ncbi:MAG: FkbM family methyltransferase [Xanthomonadales bacterium]|nr:FkbM family methyltransferase [Xanthomonadales bacterium]
MQAVKAALHPVTAAYLRHVPLSPGKCLVWRKLGQRLVRPGMAFETRTRYGHRFSGHTGDMIGRTIYFTGVWEPNLSAYLQQTLRPGDGFIDVGANHGWFALLAAGCVGPAGTVVAVEASKDAFDYLQRHVERNGAHTVRCIHAAATAEEGERVSLPGPIGNQGMARVAEVGAGAGQGAETGNHRAAIVRAAPLDTLLTDREIREARFVKIDVEGGEWHVLQGMSRLFREGRDDLEVMVELSPRLSAREGAPAARMLSFMAGLGFYPYRVENEYGVGVVAQSRTPRPPERFRGEVHKQIDLVFSRRDVERLGASL